MVRSIEDGFKKAIELAIMVIVLGYAMKLMMIIVPAVIAGSMLAKLVKISMLE